MLYYENGIEYHWNNNDLITIDTLEGNKDHLSNRIYELRLTLKEENQLKESINPEPLICDIAEASKKDWKLMYENGEEVNKPLK